MATLTYTPLAGTQPQPIEQYRKFQFEGYQQRQKEGINSWKHTVNVSFPFSKNGKLNEYPLLAEGMAFFYAQGSTIPFTFDCPGIGEKTWVCNKFSPSHIDGDLWHISADLETWNGTV